MALQEVTDPDLLKQLEAGDQEVTDPALLGQLNEEVTDPALLAQLNAADEPAAPTPTSDYHTKLENALKGAKLFGSATSAFGTSPDVAISRAPDGNWDLPLMTQTPENPILAEIGGAAVSIGQRLGARMNLAGPAIDRQAIQNVFHKFQQDNNLSDEEVQNAWSDLAKRYKGTWEPEEKTRVLSDGKIILNPNAPEILDTASAHRIIDASNAPSDKKEEAKRNLPSVQTDAAQTKLAAYEAATGALKSQAGRTVLGPFSLITSGTAVDSPSEYAKKKGIKDMSTPEFMRDYERDVISQQNPAMEFARGIATDWILSANNYAVQRLGNLAQATDSEAVAKMAAEGQTAAEMIGQGKPETGVVGQAVQQVIPIADMIYLSRAAGALGPTASTISSIASAGFQSAGQQYAQSRAEGKTHEQAEAEARRAGANTAVITGIFQGLGAGGVEKVAAGKSVGEVTLRDLLTSTTRETLVKDVRKFAANITKETLGEAAEEGIDQLTSAFLNADPDTNLSQAWDGAVEAAKAGGFIGGVVNVASGALESPEITKARDLVDSAKGYAPAAAAEAQKAVAASLPVTVADIPKVPESAAPAPPSDEEAAKRVANVVSAATYKFTPDERDSLADLLANNQGLEETQLQSLLASQPYAQKIDTAALKFLTKEAASDSPSVEARLRENARLEREKAPEKEATPAEKAAEEIKLLEKTIAEVENRPIKTTKKVTGLFGLGEQEEIPLSEKEIAADKQKRESAIQKWRDEISRLRSEHNLPAPTGTVPTESLPEGQAAPSPEGAAAPVVDPTDETSVASMVQGDLAKWLPDLPATVVRLFNRGGKAEVNQRLDELETRLRAKISSNEIGAVQGGIMQSSLTELRNSIPDTTTPTPQPDATIQRNQQEGDLSQYPNTDEGGAETTASSGNRAVEGGEIEGEINAPAIERVGQPPGGPTEGGVPSGTDRIVGSGSAFQGGETRPEGAAAPVTPKTEDLIPADVLEQIKQYPDFYEVVSKDALNGSETARYLAFRKAPKAVENRIKKEFKDGAPIATIEQAIEDATRSATQEKQRTKDLSSALTSESPAIGKELAAYRSAETSLESAKARRANSMTGTQWEARSAASQVSASQRALRAAGDALVEAYRKSIQPTPTPNVEDTQGPTETGTPEAAPTEATAGGERGAGGTQAAVSEQAAEDVKAAIRKNLETMASEQGVPVTPGMSDAEILSAMEQAPLTPQSLKSTFDLTDDQAAVAYAIAGALGITEGTELVRGGVPGAGAMSQGVGDAEYLAAVEAGDMETAQRMVDEAARAAGYDTDKTFWRGDAIPLTTFRNAVYLSESKSLAADFQRRQARRLVASGREDTSVVRPFFLKSGLKLANEDTVINGKRLGAVSFLHSPYTRQDEIGDDTTAEQVSSAGYDGAEGEMVGGDYGDTEVVVFDPSQIKSADPVTRDNQGNVIPLSQRFNVQSPDIRYQYAGEKAQIPQFMRDSLETAKTMAAAGKSSEEIRAVTGWFPGKYDGKMRWEIPDEGAELTGIVPSRKDTDSLIASPEFRGTADSHGVVYDDTDPIVQWLKANPQPNITIKNYSLGRVKVYASQVDPRTHVLGAIIDHPELFKAYPELFTLKVRQESGMNGASYESSKDEISIDLTQPNALSLLLHEVQHAIQKREGFAKGSNPQAMAGSNLQLMVNKKKLADLYRKTAMFVNSRGPLTTEIVQDMPPSEQETAMFAYDDREDRWRTPEELLAKEAELLKEIENIDFDGSEAYRRTAGEIEARDVQARQNLTPEQRAATAPYSSENIAPEAAIVLYQGPKGSAEVTAAGKVLLRGLTAPDFTTATHEMWHAFEMLDFPGLTDSERATLQMEIISQDPDGREKKGARAWERYLAEGKAPTTGRGIEADKQLQSIFDKIAEWFKDVYGRIQGSDIDVEISDAVRAIFDKLASQIVLPNGVTMSTMDGSPVPDAIPPTPENIADLRNETDPAKAQEKFIGLVRGQATEQPAPEFNPEGLYSLQEAVAREEAEKYGYDQEWSEAARTFGDLNSQAIATEENWKQSRGAGQGTAGAHLLRTILAEGNPDRVLTDPEIALLTHEGLRRKIEVEKTTRSLLSIQSRLSTASPDEAVGLKEELSKAESALMAANGDYQEMLDAAAGFRRGSGRSLNAWKYALREDFSHAALSRRYLAEKKIADPKAPATLTREESDWLLQHSLEMAKLQQDLQDAQAEAASKDAEIAELQKQVEADKATMQRRHAVSNVVRKKVLEKLTPLADEARKRLAASMKAESGDSGQAYSTGPVQDHFIVAAEWLAKNAVMPAAQFADFVRVNFGPAMVAFADKIRAGAEKLYRSTLSEITGERLPSVDAAIQNVFTKVRIKALGESPQTYEEFVNEQTPEVVDALRSLSPMQELTSKDVYDLAYAHTYEGARDFEIIDKVHQDLATIFPDITREQVVRLFTNYGKTKPPTKDEIRKQVLAARSAEKIQMDIDRLKAGMPALKTGQQREKATELMRKLTKERNNLMKEAGYTPEDLERQMASAQSAAISRMENEIKELTTALQTGVPRVISRRGVTYTESMEQMQTKLNGLRRDYAEMFKKEQTPEQRNAMLLASIERQIAEEQRLIDEGLLKREKELTPAESAEVQDARARLATLRQTKRDLYEAAHPGELALKQATDEAERAIKARQKLLAAGVPEKGPRAERGAGIDPTEELKSLWATIDALDDQIKEIRKARPDSPEKEQRKLDASIRAAEKLRAKLIEQLVSGNIAVTPKRGEPNPLVKAIRDENALLRKQLEQIKRDRGLGSYSYEAREARLFGIRKKRLEEMQDRIARKDFDAKAKPEQPTSQRIRDIQTQIEYTKIKFEEAKGDKLYRSMSWMQRKLARIYALARLRMIGGLGFDMGSHGRQLAPMTGFRMYRKDIQATLGRYFRGQKTKPEDLISYRYFKSVIDSLLSEEKEIELYSRLKSDPRMARRKKNGMPFLGPHESAYEVGDDSIRLNPIKAFRWYLYPILGIGRGISGSFYGLATGQGPRLTNLLMSTALGFAGKPGLLAAERANRTMLNVGRWEAMNLMDEITWLDTKLGAIAPRSDSYEETMTKNISILLGRAQPGKNFEAALPLLGSMFAFPSYLVSRIQAAVTTPVKTALGLFSKENRLASIKTSEMYLDWTINTALKLTLTSMIFGAFRGDDDDKEEDSMGVVLNPYHSKFGQLKIGKLFIDFSGGVLGHAQFIWGKIMQGKEISDDELKNIAMDAPLKDIKDKAKTQLLLDKYLTNRLHSNLSFLAQLGINQEFMQGGPLADMGVTVASQKILEETITNLLAKDTEMLFKELPPEQAAAAWMLMFQGYGTQRPESEDERKARKQAEHLRALQNR